MKFVASNVKPPFLGYHLLQYFRKNIKLSGKIDLLLVDKDGCPVIVEIKGQRNPGERRKGVYQLIEYSLYFSSTWVTPRLIYLTYQNIRLEKELYRFDIEPMFWDDMGIGRKNKNGLHPVYPKGTRLKIPKKFYYHYLQSKYEEMRKRAKARVKAKNKEAMEMLNCSYEDFWKEITQGCI